MAFFGNICSSSWNQKLLASFRKNLVEGTISCPPADKKTTNSKNIFKAILLTFHQTWLFQDDEYFLLKMRKIIHMGMWYFDNSMWSCVSYWLHWMVEWNHRLLPLPKSLWNRANNQTFLHRKHICYWRTNWFRTKEYWIGREKPEMWQTLAW